MKWLGVVFVILVAGFLAFVCVDCSTGKTRYLECYVADKDHIAAWTQVHTSVDTDGHTHVWTEYHPEQFRLLCQEHGGEVVAVEVREGFYRDATNGQPVTVRVRVGRLTGANYIPRIEL